jgi:FkbH-like protein
MMNLAEYSIDILVQQRRRLRRELLEQSGLTEIRIAVLGGSTTNEIVDFWELVLLSNGFRPTFFQSEYGQYFEEAVLHTQTLRNFAPDIVYLYTSFKNVQSLPPVSVTPEQFYKHVDAEFSRYQQIWSALSDGLSCQIIQNNFDPPPYRILGNLDSTASGGATRFYLTLNAKMAAEAMASPRLLIQDVASLAAQVGSARWFDWDRWFSYKLLYTVEANYEIARSLTSQVQALYGRSRKVLVLDLDNTCWGGVIGDDGPEKIVIGRETPIAEAYTAFQEYCLSLRDRGVLLAVCSKNNEAIARQGFEHPDSVLKFEHFSSFKANWEPKHENIIAIAEELNLGADSFVFVDDNPAERAIVEAQVPGIAVPNVGSDIVNYPRIIDDGRYFESISLSVEDVERANLYAENSQRTAGQSKFANYDEYLDSLEMVAEIDSFNRTYIERIAQLTNKTNQFNLTTKRYTLAEIEATISDGEHLGIYGRLRDRFGDHGLISVVLGRIDGTDLHLDLWLMSCRVLKREMEIAMLDALVERAKQRGLQRIVGRFIPTAKNDIVADHYEKLGFLRVSDTTNSSDGSTTWQLELNFYSTLTRHIEIKELLRGKPTT